MWGARSLCAGFAPKGLAAPSRRFLCGYKCLGGGLPVGRRACIVLTTSFEGRRCFGTTLPAALHAVLRRKVTTNDPPGSGNSTTQRVGSSLAQVSEEERKVLESFDDDISSMKTKVLRNFKDEFRFLSCDSRRQPMVIVLGNHSAGKSTMINRLLGLDLQRSGVSPTDDGFTVIQRGSEDITEDGPTAVSDPRYGFQDLRRFGIYFVNKFKVKTRKLPSTSLFPEGLMIVDTPGMIDTPIHLNDRTSVEGQLRGYDLFAVTRWFAARSDLIILMFDPANPGTTGETLDVLTKSLAGVEHKLLIVLNKSDVYSKAADFARVYGVLCWNLSKVLQMKDIPHIYTTYFLPCGGVEYADDLFGHRSAEVEASSNDSTTIIAREELLRQRGEVVHEVLRAPLRRYDNLITEVEEGVKRVLLAGRVCTDIVSAHRRMRATSLVVPPAILCVAATFLIAGGLTQGSLFISSAVSLGAMATMIWSQKALRDFEKEVTTNIDAVFRKLYVRYERTMDVELRWRDAVKPEILEFLKSSLESGGQTIGSLPTLSKRGQDVIVSVLKNDIPQLRVRVADFKANKFFRSDRGSS
uniref:Dynamin N-terminal domain-containing protein n=1 Tax=Trypanosoma congolense (strain IL3000) TaxID=1068625 RepID=G0UPQ2_TRYCI|nr:conserved hypothetical protein [Trypanosoma congolense IL3000]